VHGVFSARVCWCVVFLFIVGANTSYVTRSVFFLADVALQPNGLQLDGLHPTAAAQQSIMMRVSSILAEYVK
jgi:hypothetical protein